MRKLLLAAIFMAAALLPAQQPSQRATGRFQIIVATIGNGDIPNEKPVHTVFLLDTETGQTWRYFAGAGATRDLSGAEQHAIGAAKLTGVNPGLFVPIVSLAPQSEAIHHGH